MAMANATTTITSFATVTLSIVEETGPRERVSLITAMVTEGELAMAMEPKTNAIIATTPHSFPSVNGRRPERARTRRKTTTNTATISAVRIPRISRPLFRSILSRSSPPAERAMRLMAMSLMGSRRSRWASVTR